MKLSISSLIPQNAATLWLGITLILWWLGIAGRDIYLLPAIVFLGICIFQIRKGEFSNNSINWINDYSNKRCLIAFYWIHVGLYLLTTILKYYSFRWNIWDVGSYSNMLFNISQGRFYSSYLGSHNWADHFTPSLSPLSLFYSLAPSTHWLTLAKTIAYLSVPLLIYKICRESFQNKERAWSVTIILGAAWMLFYAPALNSLYYEFQPSALAPPFILYAFLCFQRKQWLRFWLTMFVLLGFKEHLGAVWIGFGCFMVLATPNKKMGFILISGGIISIYLIMFQVMPYFRNYEESWSMALGPFQDIPKKLIYLFNILIPLGFLPLIFWRFGIMAGPAIGINLLSSHMRPEMYSTSYHYDDIPATLLILAMILIISSSLHKFRFWQEGKASHWLLTGWMVCVLGLLPSSPMRELYAAIPDKSHWDIRKELVDFDQLSKENSIAVQTSLGPQFNRTNILAITQDSNGNCAPMRRGISVLETEYLVFAKSLNHYLIEDLEQCLKKMMKSSDYESLAGYNHLNIYKKTD